MIKRVLLSGVLGLLCVSGCATPTRSFATMASIKPGEVQGTFVLTLRVEEIQQDGSRRTITAPRLVVNEGSPAEITTSSDDKADAVMVRAFVPGATPGAETKINVTVKENFRIVGQTDVTVATR